MVTTVGQNKYSVASVMKDGTIATSADSNPMDMNWTNGYNGSDTSPITQPILLSKSSCAIIGISPASMLKGSS